MVCYARQQECTRLTSAVCSLALYEQSLGGSQAVRCTFKAAVLRSGTLLRPW